MGYIPPVSMNNRTTRVSVKPLNAKIDAIRRMNRGKMPHHSHPKFMRKEFPKYFGQYVDRKV